jgi:hypothetical protein
MRKVLILLSCTILVLFVVTDLVKAQVMLYTHTGYDRCALRFLYSYGE